VLPVAYLPAVAPSAGIQRQRQQQQQQRRRPGSKAGSGVAGARRRLPVIDLAGGGG